MRIFLHYLFLCKQKKANQKPFHTLNNPALITTPSSHPTITKHFHSIFPFATPRLFSKICPKFVPKPFFEPQQPLKTLGFSPLCQVAAVAYKTSVYQCKLILYIFPFKNPYTIATQTNRPTSSPGSLVYQ